MNNSRNGQRGDIEFRLEDHIGVLAEYQTGWKKELNVISWNGGAPKIDIRDWDPEHEHMSRGITLHREEAEKLYGLLEETLTNQERAARLSAASSNAV